MTDRRRPLGGRKDLVSDRGFVLVMAGVSLALTALVLNRWLVVDLGLKSLSRLWPYYVSWTDFGFFRRGLVGTVLTVTQVNSLIPDQYAFSLVFQSVVLVAVTVVLVVAVLRMEPVRSNRWLCAAVFLSPAFLIHLAYATGTLDPVLVLVFAVAVLLVRSPSWTCVLVVVGVLTHELFLFMVPGVVIIHYLRPTVAGRRKHLLGVLAIVVVSLLAAAAIHFFGRLDIDRSTYDSVMQTRIPQATEELSLWSGYFEVSSTVSAQSSIGPSDIGANWYFMVIPTACAVLAAVGAVDGLRGSRRDRLLLLAACLVPLATLLLATDYYRWVALSSIVALLAMVRLTGDGVMNVRRPILVALTCCALLAPFGAAGLNRPFPLHQLLIDRVTSFFG